MRLLVLALALIQAVASVPSPVRPPPPAETLVLPEGTRLHAGPDEHALSIAVLDAEVELPVLERRGEWVLVRWGSLAGWALPGHETGPLLLEEPAVPQLPPDLPASVDAARRLLGLAARTRCLGPYTLLTDVQRDDQLEPLDRVSASVEETYRARFGADPGPARGELVVLFSSAADLSIFENIMGAHGAEGHAAHAISAFTSERGDPEELRAAWIHTMVHLLTRRAGIHLSRWIHEGMAEDLAYAEVDAHDRVLPGTVRLGARALVEHLQERQRRGELGEGKLVVLNMVNADSSELGPAGSSTNALPALLVRYLLADGDGWRAARFRRLVSSSRAQPVGVGELLGDSPVRQTGAFRLRGDLLLHSDQFARWLARFSG